MATAISETNLKYTELNLDEAVRGRLVEMLNQILADLTDLRMQTYEAHWNVRGPHFFAQHKLFEELSGLIGAPLDDLAERITALGGFAGGSARRTAALSSVAELPVRPSGPTGYVEALQTRYAAVANRVREAVKQSDAMGDEGSADLLTGISRDIDKALWLLEAHDA